MYVYTVFFLSSIGSCLVKWSICDLAGPVSRGITEVERSCRSHQSSAVGNGWQGSAAHAVATDLLFLLLFLRGLFPALSMPGLHPGVCVLASLAKTVMSHGNNGTRPHSQGLSSPPPGVLLIEKEGMCSSCKLRGWICVPGLLNQQEWIKVEPKMGFRGTGWAGWLPQWTGGQSGRQAGHKLETGTG